MRWLVAFLMIFSLFPGGAGHAFSDPASGAVSNQYNRNGIVTGTAGSAATVTINATAAPRQGPWWGQSNTAASGSSAAWLDFSIDARRLFAFAPTRLLVRWRRDL